MSEHFLEEQLKRIREMTERVSRLRADAAEVSQEVVRDRALMRRSPLHDVRDFRSYSGEEAPAAASDRRPPQRQPRGRRR